MDMNLPQEKINGYIERITFHSDETGFCVLKIKAKGQRDLVTVLGSAASVCAGEYIEAEGTWINDTTYGLQFKAQQLKTAPPTTLDGIEKYLGSGMIKGIGPFYAKKLVQTFGDQVFNIFDKAPSQLLKITGIGEKRQELIMSSWEEQKSIREIMIFLQAHGVGTARAVRIYKTYGDSAIEKVRENPYRLAQDIYGIGFKTADLLAQRLGIAADSIIRARAGVIYALQELSNEGHCAAFESDLANKSSKLLDIQDSIIKEAIEKEIAAKNLIQDEIASERAIYLAPLYNAEISVAKNLERLNQGNPPWGAIDHEAAIPWVEEKTGLQFAPSQKKAIIQALKNKVTIITGGPGVGKTTIVNSFIKMLRAKHLKIALCAPTGRAAKRLTETTGMEAKTIHRLLRFDPKNRSFVHHANNPLIAELVIVDEASMIDIVLMHSLLKAIPDNAALLIVGDVDQLPSVGPGTVLADIINSGAISTVILKEIFRQAADSRIIVNAHRINQGLYPWCEKDPSTLTDFYMIPAENADEIQQKLLQVVTERIPKKFGFNPIREIQVLSPMNRGGLGARALNIALQEKLNGKALPKVNRFGWTFAPGDKVIQNVNNYDKDVFNGDIGTIKEIDLENSNLLIQFDDNIKSYDFTELDEISLAYAISIHKSQGSEYPAIVIPLAMQHFMMLARNLIYTAVTRGKKLVVLIGEPKALAIAVHNTKTTKRLTNLCARLKHLTVEKQDIPL